MASGERKSFEEYRKNLNVSDKAMRGISEQFERQIHRGLQESQKDEPYMIWSRVAELPTGNEFGECFGIHISGSHIQIVYTHLSDEPHEVSLVQLFTVPISEHMKACTAEEFFAYVADKTHLFSMSISRDLLTRKKRFSLGLAFSFPCIHSSLKSGELLKWTKGFDIDGALGHDPVKMLNAAFKTKGLNVATVIMCNDAVAEICATRYTLGPRADIAVVIDTGSNAAFVEEIGHSQQMQTGEGSSMVINTEWPNFNPQSFQILAEDVAMDKESAKPGEQPFEKLTGALYLGDIARRVLVSLAQSQDWPMALDLTIDSLPGDFDLDRLIKMAEDSSESLTITGQLLQEMYRVHSELFDQSKRGQAKEICSLLLERSARLVAAATLGIMQHKDIALYESEIGCDPVIGVAGQLFHKSALYRTALHNALNNFSAPSHKNQVRTQLYEIIAGAAFGAATLAAASSNCLKSLR